MTLGALSLFAAVSTTYLYTWYSTGDLVLAQTMAFATWMVGHIFLALNFRSEKEPLAKLGLLFEQADAAVGTDCRGYFAGGNKPAVCAYVAENHELKLGELGNGAGGVVCGDVLDGT